MPRFYYRKKYNQPVCEDAGDITEIRLITQPVVGLAVGQLVCDGKEFWVNGSLAWGTASFHPAQDERSRHVGREVTLPLSLQDGDEIIVEPDDWYYFEPEGEIGYQRVLDGPICTDPRVLCILHRSEEILGRERRGTDENRRAICSYIPSREEACAYLQTHGYVDGRGFNKPSEEEDGPDSSEADTSR